MGDSSQESVVLIEGQNEKDKAQTQEDQSQGELLKGGGTFIIEEGMKTENPPSNDLRLPVHLVQPEEKSQLKASLRAWTGLLTTAQIELPELCLSQEELADIPEEVRAKMCTEGWSWMEKGGALGMLGHLLLSPENRESAAASTAAEGAESEEKKLSPSFLQALMATHGIAFALTKKLAAEQEKSELEPRKKRQRTISSGSPMELSVEVAGETHKIHLPSDLATIEDLKDAIQEVTGMNWWHQRLFKDKREPIEGLVYSLGAFKIQDGDSLSVEEGPFSRGITANALKSKSKKKAAPAPGIARTSSINSALERMASQASIDPDEVAPTPPLTPAQSFTFPRSASFTGSFHFPSATPPPTPPTQPSFGFGGPGVTVTTSTHLSTVTSQAVRVWGCYRPLPGDLKLTEKSSAKRTAFKRITEGCEDKSWTSFQVAINHNTTPRQILSAIALAAVTNHFYFSASPTIRNDTGESVNLDLELSRQRELCPEGTSLYIY